MAPFVLVLTLLGAPLPIVQQGAPVVVGVRQTVLVETKVGVRRAKHLTVPDPNDVVVRVRAPSAGEKVEVLPWIEVAKVTARDVTLRVPIMGIREGPADIRFAVEIFEPGDRDPVAVRPLRLSVTVEPFPATAQLIDQAAAALRRHEAEASRAHAALGPSKTELAVDALARPVPSAPVVAEEAKPLAAFYHHRLRAIAARHALRAFADDRDPDLARRAVLAIGAHDDATQVDTAIIDRVTNAEAIALIAAAVDDLELDRSQSFADALLASGRLDPKEFAAVSALRGLVQHARGDDERARRSLGRALCLAPDLALDVKRPMFVEAIADARGDDRCPRPLAVQRVIAERVGSDTGPRLAVVTTFGPDPYQLVAKGVIQLWTYEGTLATSITATALHVGEPRLEASFGGVDVEQDGYVLMKVFLQDANGIEVASSGDPDPLAVPVTIGAGGGAGVPWWIWAIAGGVVVAGAATVGIVALSRGGEIERVIGPVDVRF